MHWDFFVCLYMFYVNLINTSIWHTRVLTQPGGNDTRLFVHGYVKTWSSDEAGNISLALVIKMCMSICYWFPTLQIVMGKKKMLRLRFMPLKAGSSEKRDFVMYMCKMLALLVSFSPLTVITEFMYVIVAHQSCDPFSKSSCIK